MADLVPLAGPADEDVLCPVEPDEWEADVESMEASIEDGWDPPPLLVEYQDGQLLLQDGNHRYEALVRGGAPRAWVLVYGPDTWTSTGWSRPRPNAVDTADSGQHHVARRHHRRESGFAQCEHEVVAVVRVAASPP